ncbi:phage tail tube protein [Oceanihabitans sediminis]|uniref:phage tail tube protein n=1 Tax=Oceanihabitans sediminis TaxID=1812012 RepID=UPI00299DDC31|nr:phage tail tube protein [Oceanihabitans sediminis]MDX1278563.1 phage tail tube protein [Oceanihabitans sediminis]
MVNTGYKQKLYFGDEDNYGTIVPVDQPIGLVQSVSPTESNNLMKIRTLGGTRDFSNIVAGKFEVSGTFDYYLQGGAFLRQAIGEDTGTTDTVDSGPRNPASGNYLHVMGSAASPLADNFPSFTLDFTDYEGPNDPGNFRRTYNGCRVNTLSISGTVDEPVSVTCDWMAMGVTVSTTDNAAVTEYTQDPYVFYQGAVYSTTGTIDSSTVIDEDSVICEVNSFDFSVNNNLEATWYICGTTSTDQTLRGLKGLIPKGREYDASLNLHFKDSKMYQRFLGSDTATTSQGTLTKYQVVIDFVRQGTIGTPATGDDWMRIVMEDCAFDDMNITGAPEDIVNESIGVFVRSAKIYVSDDDADYTS